VEGLKIRRASALGGSTPPPGTTDCLFQRELVKAMLTLTGERAATEAATVFNFTFPIEPAKFFEANTNCL
jgi:hypothetical protein